MNIGRWSNDENLIYYKYLSLYQINNNTNKLNYNDLSNIMKTRTYTQIRSHHQRQFEKILKDAELLLTLKNKEFNNITE